MHRSGDNWFIVERDSGCSFISSSSNGILVQALPTGTGTQIPACRSGSSCCNTVGTPPSGFCPAVPQAQEQYCVVPGPIPQNSVIAANQVSAGSVAQTAELDMRNDGSEGVHRGSTSSGQR